MTNRIFRKAAALWPRAVPAAMIAVAPFAAAAQTGGPEDTTKLADQLAYCAGMPAEQERLQCYDTLAQPLLGLEKGGGAAAAIHSFTGRDDWDSEPFEVMQPWRVTWQNEGSLLTVELRGEQGEMLDVIGNQIGRGGGRSEVQEPGVYRLAVRGLGGWRVQIVDE